MTARAALGVNRKSEPGEPGSVRFSGLYVIAIPVYLAIPGLYLVPRQVQAVVSVPDRNLCPFSLDVSRG